MVALLGILLGWRGPRAPRLTEGLVAFCVFLAYVLGLVLASTQSILRGALAVAVFVALSVTLVGLLERGFLLLWAGAALGLIVAPLLLQPIRAPVLVVAVVVAALAAWRRPRRLLALNCALLGGWLVVQGLGLARGWVVLTAAALFGLQELHRLRWQEPRRGRRPELHVALAALGTAALSAAGVLLLPALVRDLPAAPAIAASHALEPLEPLPFAERRARLHDAASHGGLVWPLPSEAILWGRDADPGLYPRVETLDARFLGAEIHFIRRLPGTDLHGAFSLHRAIATLRRVPDAPADGAGAIADPFRPSWRPAPPWARATAREIAAP